MKNINTTSSSCYNDDEVVRMTVSKAQLRAKARYSKKTYERIAFDVRRDAEINGDYIRSHAESMGESVNSFIKRAVAEAIERDKVKNE